MVKKLLLIMLFLYGTTFGSTHVISSLPYDFYTSNKTDTWDTLITSGNLSTTGSGIRIESNGGNSITNVVLIMTGDTITFGTDGGNSYYGLRISGTIGSPPINIKVVDGTILHRPTGSTADENVCLTFNGSHIVIDGLRAEVDGRDAQCVIGGGSEARNDTLRNFSFESLSTEYTSRCQYDGAIGLLTSMNVDSLSNPSTEFNIVIENGEITGGPWGGFFISGSRSSYNVASVTNESPIVVTTTSAHNYYTGDSIYISNVLGTTSANHTVADRVPITRISSTQFSIDGSTGNGTHLPEVVVNAANDTFYINVGYNESPIRIITASAHGLSTGNSVTISNVQGLTNANGTHNVTVVNATQFTLDGTTGNGTRVAQTTNKLNLHKTKISGNTITTDAVNDLYPSYAGTCLSTSNPYCVGMVFTAGGSIIYNNTFTSGTARGGNRGVLLEETFAPESNPVIVRKNTMTLNEGPNVEYGDGLPLHAIRIRYEPSHILVDSNNITGYGDSNAGTTHIGTSVQAIRLSQGYEENDFTKVIVRNNTIQTIANDASVSSCNAIVFDLIEYDSLYYTEYNNITSSGNIYQFGEGNGESNGQVIVGDTVQFYGALTLSGAAVYYMGYSGNPWDCSDNMTRDVVYNSPAAYTSLTYTGAGVQELTHQRLLTFTVTNQSAQPVQNATVRLVNNYGQTLINDQLTDENGQVTGIVNWLYNSRLDTDSSSFNDFTATASLAGDTTIQVFTVNASSDVTRDITLSATEGNSSTRNIKGRKINGRKIKK